MPPIDDNETKRVPRHLPCLARIDPPTDELRETVRDFLVDYEIPSCREFQDREVRRYRILCEDTQVALNAGRLTRRELVMWGKDCYEYLDMMADP
ncbi:MAG: hypothetical protein IID05_13640 [Gemmatimonadetes bacterium]|nr:hypothetical protein [Gemmatimonadota bacterium]